MSLFAAMQTGNPLGQLATAVVLGALAIYWLLPRPRGRSIAIGTFAAIASTVVLVSWVVRRFGDPAPDLVGNILFWLFSAGAVGFATIFVCQRNPGRGAIAFAFVILSVCGLFLLLAAPFLMAATIVIYAGAIIVTFLFVLMLSHADGPTDENDRTREPMLGSLAGFAFLGLVLFALYQSSPAAASDTNNLEYALPARPVSGEERAVLLEIAEQLGEVTKLQDKDAILEKTKLMRDRIAEIVGVPPTSVDAVAVPSKRKSIPDRLALLTDPRSIATKTLGEEIRQMNVKAFNALENNLLSKANPSAIDIQKSTEALPALREKLIYLAGRGELPARNVANIGYVLYSEYLLAIEMAGTILLVATIGTVAIATRKRVSA